MNRLALPIVLILTTLLSGCARLAYLPNGKHHVYTDSNQRMTSRSRSSIGNHTYDPKTRPYTVMGRTYYPLRSASGYDERGVASWYGRDFHGKATASGDLYDMNALTAAHKTLPLGTIVRVTNLHNGRSIDLLVNDRGPFVNGRLIDLSYAAARRLGSATRGLAQVRVQAIGSRSERVKLASPRLTRTSTRSANYYIQVGTFSMRDNALKVLSHLKHRGYQNSRIEIRRNGSATLHVVKAGSFEALPSAKRALWKLRPQFPSSFIVS